MQNAWPGSSLLGGRLLARGDLPGFPPGLLLRLRPQLALEEGLDPECLVQVCPGGGGRWGCTVRAVFPPGPSRWGHAEPCTSQAFQSFAETFQGGMWVKGDALVGAVPVRDPRPCLGWGGPLSRLTAPQLSGDTPRALPPELWPKLFLHQTLPRSLPPQHSAHLLEDFLASLPQETLLGEPRRAGLVGEGLGAGLQPVPPAATGTQEGLTAPLGSLLCYPVGSSRSLVIPTLLLVPEQGMSIFAQVI